MTVIVCVPVAVLTLPVKCTVPIERCSHVGIPATVMASGPSPPVAATNVKEKYCVSVGTSWFAMVVLLPKASNRRQR